MSTTLSQRFRGFYPVIIDVETAGFNSQTDALLEIAAVTLTMDDDGNIYPVHQNYASKSKIVAGDTLSLRTDQDGILRYKQVNFCPRIRAIVKAEKEGNSFVVTYEGKKFKMLNASISFYKIKEGTEVAILLPKFKKTEWATVDNVL